MPRRILGFAAFLAAVALGAWGCQQYNFNPVGSCVIQPGSHTVTLSDVSVADVLFVVDDSGSMNSKQQNLARNFAAFIFALAQENRARVASGLKPLEFHIALTTSSVFRVWGNAGSSPPTYHYSNKYDDAVNQSNNGCTTVNAGACDGTNNGQQASCGVGTVCGGYQQCCYCVPGISVGQTTQQYPDGDFVAMGACSGTGALCTPNVSGSCPAGQTCQANPKVLHFTASLPWSSWGCSADSTCTASNVGASCGGSGGSCGSPGSCCLPLCTNDASCSAVGAACGTGNVCGAVGQCCIPPPGAIQTLIDQFKENVQVGTCGSAQEQHLQAARRAVQKAMAGQQGLAAGEWPHAGAKLVVAVMGDEDDCSAPAPSCADPTHCTAAEMASSVALSDPTGALGICPLSLQLCTPGVTTCSDGETCSPLSGLPGRDGCTYDEGLAKAGQPYNEYKLQDLYAYFAGLGKPVGDAAVVSTQDGSCSYSDSGATCQSGICCDYACTGSGSVCTSPQCGGQAAGVRHVAFTNLFRSNGYDAVTGSICDQQFDQTLKNIAQLVKSPSTLSLPSLPAAGDITVVRIANSSGETLRVCPQAATQAQADTNAYGWWFYDCGSNTNPPPVATSPPTTCIYIDHASGTCEANPGETYSAEYLGQVPAGGCPTPACTFGVAACGKAGDDCGAGNACVGKGECCPLSLYCSEALLGPCTSEPTCVGASGTSTSGCPAPRTCDSGGNCCPPLEYACYGASGATTGTCVCAPRPPGR